MLYKLFVFLALVAVAFASPKPEPQVPVAYTAGVYPAAAYPYYSGGVLPYAAGGAVWPYAYNGYYIR